MSILILRYLTVFLLGSLVTWAICDKIAEGQVAAAKLAHQKELVSIERRGRDESEQAKRELRAVQSQIASKDAANNKQLEDTRNEINRLNDCLRTGKCGLRVNATCQAGTRNPIARDPGSATPSGLDDDQTPVLTPVAESAYFALRQGLNVKERQLTMCQDYVMSLPGNK